MGDIDHVAAGAGPDMGSTAGLTDVDPVPGSVRHALPPLAPPLDRGVQPVVAAGVVAALLVVWWLRRRWLARPGSR